MLAAISNFIDASEVVSLRLEREAERSNPADESIIDGLQVLVSEAGSLYTYTENAIRRWMDRNESQQINVQLGRDWRELVIRTRAVMGRTITTSRRVAQAGKSIPNLVGFCTLYDRSAQLLE